MDNLGIFSIFFLKKTNILCDPSLDASDRDGSVEGGTKYMYENFRNKKNCL